MKRAIIDTDMGVDDALALLLAFGSGQLEIEAITTVGGNVPVERATANLSLLLEFLQPHPRPLTARGAASPLVYPLESSTHVHGEDGLGGASRLRDEGGKLLYPPEQNGEPLADAAASILDAVRRFPGGITLITLGPLTNVARAIAADRPTMLQLRELVIMGGALRVPGNASPCAEFNIYVDPHAAALALDMGVPTTLVPLDATHQARLSSQDVAELEREAPGPISRFVRDVSAHYRAFHRAREGWDGCYLHDPLAVAVAYDPSLARAEPVAVGVETDGRLTRGMTVADFRPGRQEKFRHVSACLEVNSGSFRQHFLATLAGLSKARHA